MSFWRFRSLSSWAHVHWDLEQGDCRVSLVGFSTSLYWYLPCAAVVVAVVVAAVAVVADAVLFVVSDA